MSDNVDVTAGTGTSIGADEVIDATLGTVKVGYVKIMDGTIDGTAKATVGASGLEVNVKAIIAIPAGNNNIGDVDIASIAAGNNNIGDVDVASIAAGDNNIGNVDIVTMPNVVIGSGTVTTVSTVTNLSQQSGVAISIATGVRDAGTQRVTVATDDLVPVKIASGQVNSGAIASGAIASGAVASGAFASGSISSGAVASGAIASGAIAVGAITAGDTSIATTEDTPRAGGEHLVKIGIARFDTPVANAGVNTDGDYTSFIADNFGKQWVSGTVPEDTAHVVGEALTVVGERRIDPCATSSGSDGDWSAKNQSAEGASWATLTPTTASGLSVANFTSGDTYTALTNASQVIKASAGNLYGYYIYNPNVAATYVMIYNIASASVTVGTSTALLVFCIPASSGANMTFPYPISFSNAGWSIAAATTGGGASAPSTALEAMIFYK